MLELETLFMLVQTRRHGGALRGRDPPNHCLLLPKLELWPKKSNRLGAIGVQFEA